jgi:hypothetical protein
MRWGKVRLLIPCGILISGESCYADYSLDPEGTFDIPKFEGTVFGKGSAGKGEIGSKEDGFFVN